MCCMRNKTKAAVTINRLGEKQGERGGRRGIFGDHMVLRGERRGEGPRVGGGGGGGGGAGGGGGGGGRRGEGTRLPPPPPPAPSFRRQIMSTL